MADPFFAQGNDDDDDDDETIPQISYNQIEKSERKQLQSNHSPKQQNKYSEYQKKQTNDHKPPKYSYKNDKKSSHSKEKKPRLPSMLDDVQAPKPLHINPLKPPGSKILFDYKMPDQIKYAEPYD